MVPLIQLGPLFQCMVGGGHSHTLWGVAQPCGVTKQAELRAEGPSQWYPFLVSCAPAKVYPKSQRGPERWRKW